MTHKQWFTNVLHLHPVHEEGASKFSSTAITLTTIETTKMGKVEQR